MWFIRLIAIIGCLAAFGHNFWSFSLFDLEHVPDAFENPSAAMVNFAQRHRNNEKGIFGLPLLGEIQLSMALNLIGNYVCVVPVLIGLRRWLRSSSPRPTAPGGTVPLLLVDVATVCGAIYLAAGGLGAAILVRLFPLSVNMYSAAASSVEMRSIEHLHFVTVELVHHSFWGCFETVFAALLFFCIAARIMLYSSNRSLLFGFLTLVLCVANKLIFLLEIGKYALPAQLYQTLFVPTLMTHLMLAPLWTVIAAFKITSATPPHGKPIGGASVSQERSKKD